MYSNTSVALKQTIRRLNHREPGEARFRGGSARCSWPNIHYLRISERAWQSAIRLSTALPSDSGRTGQAASRHDLAKTLIMQGLKFRRRGEWTVSIGDAKSEDAGPAGQQFRHRARCRAGGTKP